MSLNDKLMKYGWDADLEQASIELEVGTEPARIAAVDRGSFLLFTESSERRGVPRNDVEDLATGDWVIVGSGPPDDLAPILRRLPRKTKLARKVAGKRAVEQTIVANVDTVFVVAGLGSDLNERRIERYLALIWAGGARPVVVLTKSDVCDDVPGALASVMGVAMAAPVHAVSSVTADGLDELQPYLAAANTVATVGSSGAGKSTLINALCGEEIQVVRELGWYGKGQHTTTRRELIVAPSGVLLVDTPGLREVGLWEAGEGIDSAFSDIEELAGHCRFGDCRHEGEPGCAVAGNVPADRLVSYHKLQRETHFVATRADKAIRAAERRKWRQFERSRRKDSY